MFYLRSFVIGLSLTLSYTCNGQVYCDTQGCLASANCTWNLPTNNWYCVCRTGYFLNPFQVCVDINECLELDVCGSFSAGRCYNTEGSYWCDCYIGYTLDNNKCIDINECLDHDVCGSSTAGQCYNIAGSYWCQCNFGYTLDNNKCRDNNKCSNFNLCGPNKRCVSTLGSYRCECYQGFMLINNQCTDINECSERDFCGSPSAGECHNRVGSYWCDCYVGYTLDNNKCRDVDECQFDGPCDPYAQCTNFPGGYSCTCNTGFSGDGKNCTDTDECLAPDLCGLSSAGQCVNMPGSYNCICSTGYDLDNAGKCTVVTNSNDGQLEKGAQVVGIAVGVVVGTVALVIIGVILLIRFRNKKRSSEVITEYVYVINDVNHEPQSGLTTMSTQISPSIMPTETEQMRAHKDNDVNYINISDDENRDGSNAVTYEEVSVANPSATNITIPQTTYPIADAIIDHEYIVILDGQESTPPNLDNSQSSHYEALSPENNQSDTTYSSLQKYENI